MFKEDLNKLGKGGPVTVRINSGGGEVFAASVIRSIIMDYPGRVTTRIDGLCASAATYVAMAGDRVLMQDSAFFMIHDPSMLAWGTIDTIKAALDELKVVKNGIIQAYQSKTQLETEKLSKMMSAETWMSAQEAQTLGFVDEVITGASKTARLQNRAFLNCVVNIENVPASLLEEETVDEPIETENVPDEEATSEASESDSDNAAEETVEESAEETVSAQEKEAQRMRAYLKIFGPKEQS